MTAPQPNEPPHEGGTISRTHTGLGNVGRCRTLAELGRGGMADVYLAVTRSQSGFNKLVVLKALKRELATERTTLDMFLDEARVAAQLNHPSVVQTYEVGMHGDRHVMVMEYLEGQSLSQLLRQARAKEYQLTVAMLVRIMIGALEGLHYAHELNGYDGKPLHIVHRDVSPQNIFVTYSGHVKVLDFGIAKAVGSSTETLAGTIKGKLSYMSPEQVSGAKVDRRADVFTVGCILWQFATGTKLWHGEPDVQIVRHLLDGEVPSPSAVKADCDPDFVSIIERCMAHDPDARYASALEVQQELERYLDRFGKPLKAKDIGAVVSDLFKEERIALRRIVEEQLKRIEADEHSLTSVPVLGSGDVHSSSHLGSGAVPITYSAPRRRHLLLPALVAALVAGGAVFAWQRIAANEQEQARLIAEKARLEELARARMSPAAAPLAPERVEIRFAVSPENARLFLDDELLEEGTVVKVLATDGARHTLRAEAPGYETRRLEFVPSADATLELELPKVVDKEKTSPDQRTQSAARAPRRHSAGPAAPPASNPTSPPASPRVDCSNPFFLDADGIKRIRAECR